MMSQIPTRVIPNSPESDNQLLRAGMIAELDAINLYEQLADNTNKEGIRKLFLDIAKEEKTL